VLHVEPGGSRLRSGGEELLGEPGNLWVDLTDPDAESLAALAQRFGLHRLEVEDCLHLDQRPKLEEYPGHLFIVVHGFEQQGEAFDDLALHEVHMFLGKDFLLTVHSGPCPQLREARARVEKDAGPTLGRGTDFVAYLVADALVDSQFPLLDRFNDELEDLETRIFESPEKSQMQRIFEIKRGLVLLRRVLSPQRDVVALLARTGIPYVQERSTLYFRDVYDHLVRLYEQIDAGRDLVGNAFEGYLSMVANRTGEVTKQLTIFATLFLPLSFITGFFGQNFDVLSRRELFFTMLALMVAVPSVLFVWFRRQNWL
jgi:magnesium transporter